MSDIVIGQCDLRIRRPAGTAPPWLADDDHRALARRVQGIVLPMLEELLAPRLAARPGAQGRNLRLDLKLTALDLSGVAPLARPALRARLVEAVENALADAEAAPFPDTPARPDASAADTPAPPVRTPAPATGIGATAATYLTQLFADDHSAAAARLLPTDRLVDLLAQTLAALAAGRSEGSPTIGSTDNAGDHPAPDRLPDRQRAELLAVLRELASLARAPVGDDAMDTAAGRAAQRAIATARRLLDRVRMARPAVTKAVRGTEQPHSDTAISAPRSEAEGHEPRPAGSSVNTALPVPLLVEASAGIAPGRYFVDHVLPFLGLAVLARHGIANALMLDTKSRDVLAAVAAAVALKSLPPDTARGAGAWPAGARQAVTLASGLDSAPDGATFAAAAGRLGNSGSFARAAAAAALLGSLAPRCALPLVVRDDRLALFDPGGLYPVAAGAPETLLPLLADIGRLLFLHGTEPTVWAALVAAGLPVVAGGPPLADEQAAPVIGPRGWMGRASATARLSPGLRARLPDDAAVAGRAAEVWSALGPQASLLARPALGGNDRLFDELTTLLAGFVLADMGWALWRRDAATWEQPDPLLVRDRFADLSGWVEVGTRRITVALPLGRRFSDLRDAGLLDTVAGLPWWPGREIAFRGG
jgi:hypothetical protein